MLRQQEPSVKKFALLTRLIEAIRQSSKLDVLLRLLREDIVVYTDDKESGPPAPPRQLVGIGQCSKFLEKSYPEEETRSFQLRYLQERPTALFYHPGNHHPLALLMIEESEGRIRKIYFLRHPERIRRRLRG